MADAARRIENEGFFGVDINFGCAASSICRQAGGAALLKEPALAASIVREIRRAVHVPVFVKFRTGWRDDPQFAAEMARRFEEAGADALTFHPRVAPDRRSHHPKWEYIGLVKAAVRIPVFGNGNVFDAGDCLKIITQTGCDAVAVGRIAVARPWIGTQWSNGLSVDPPPYYETAFLLTQLLSDHYPPKDALRRFIRFSLYFSANFLFGHTLYSRILNTRDMNAARQCLTEFFETPPEVVSRPNMNFLI
jgi:tRNA-dihydrouridine synthase